MTLLPSTLDAGTKDGAANHRPILVTGSHRSGSTWVGKILARAPGVGYIHEPFKPTVSPGIFPKRFPNWYQYLCAENEGDYPKAFFPVLNFGFSIRSAWTAVKTPRDGLRVLRHWFGRTRLRCQRRRPLMKDPMALFSAEWLARHFDMQPVILIRHPAAFASSLKVKRWNVDFRILLRQPLLIRDHLAQFESELIDYANNPREIVDRAALLWKCIYSVVAGFKERHPDWIFLRHEDLSLYPLAEFRQLYERLGLTFTPKVQRFIEETSGAHNPAERVTGGGVRRDSAKNVQNWKQRLTPEEIKRVRSTAGSVAKLFYDESEW